MHLSSDILFLTRCREAVDGWIASSGQGSQATNAAFVNVVNRCGLRA